MNPESGKKKKIKTYEEFYDILRIFGYDTEIIFTKSKGDAENIIQTLNDDISLVVSAGGDGTLNEIVTGNMKRQKKLVIAPLPLGSTNDVGNMYGLDKTIYENLETLLKGKAKKVDICYINEKPFVYVACLGEYINMAYATPQELKQKYEKDNNDFVDAKNEKENIEDKNNKEKQKSLKNMIKSTNKPKYRL